MSEGTEASRLNAVLEAIDALNAEDPNAIEYLGSTWPKELLHARRASDWLERIAPDATEWLRIAVRAHHLRRWAWPRSDHPAGRAGYHAWRRSLQVRHAEETGRLMTEHGYGADQIERVGQLIRKQGLGRDPEVQTFEDVLCLVFVEMQLESFSARYDDDKVIGVLARTLPKMSAGAQAIAGDLVSSVGNARLERLLAAAVERVQRG